MRSWPRSSHGVKLCDATVLEAIRATWTYTFVARLLVVTVAARPPVFGLHVSRASDQLRSADQSGTKAREHHIQALAGRVESALIGLCVVAFLVFSA